MIKANFEKPFYAKSRRKKVIVSYWYTRYKITYSQTQTNNIFFRGSVKLYGFPFIFVALVK